LLKHLIYFSKALTATAKWADYYLSDNIYQTIQYDNSSCTLSPSTLEKQQNVGNICRPQCVRQTDSLALFVFIMYKRTCVFAWRILSIQAIFASYWVVSFLCWTQKKIFETKIVGNQSVDSTASIGIHGIFFPMDANRRRQLFDYQHTFLCSTEQKESSVFKRKFIPIDYI